MEDHTLYFGRGQFQPVFPDVTVLQVVVLLDLLIVGENGVITRIKTE